MTPRQTMSDETYELADQDFGDEDHCAECGASLDDNEGYDGYCGSCADMIEAHDQGEHTTSYTGCPTCPLA